VSVAVVGVLFVGLISWRIVPSRKQAVSAGFESGQYFSEVRIVEDSKAVDRSLREVEQMLDESDAQIIGMVRGEMRLSAPNPRRILRTGDILVIEVDPKSLSTALSSLGVKLEEAVPPKVDEDEEADDDAPESTADPASERNATEPSETGSAEKSRAGDVVFQEFVVTPNAEFVGRSATDIDLRTQFGINLLAISRQGRQSVRRLRSTPIEGGDVLLLQGPSEALAGFAARFGCLPLAQRDIRVPKKGHALKASLILGAAIVATSFGVLSAAIAFALAALAFVVAKLVPLRSVYTSIDWSVVVLLGAMLPVADAMGTTGTADLIARFLLETVSQGHVIAALVVLLVVTMFLSDLMNNVATAAVMCPIALSSAQQFGVNADAFLMAIAIGSSCAFLTPIGHQNNTLILGPGGFHFGDYWRLGLAVEAIVLLISVPMLLWVWPL
ncbi:SLC13 family permease, partial [Dokdonella sp.]|uniref:SLC13 family permease n=1 Tax=Dokdonella sp. TaxID=2291710 RepID=UPI003C472A4B